VGNLSVQRVGVRWITSVHNHQLPNAFTPFADFGVPEEEVFVGGVVEVVFITHPADIGLLAGGEQVGDGAEKR